MITDSSDRDESPRNQGHIDDPTFWLDRVVFDTDSDGRPFIHEPDEIIVEASALAVPENRERLGYVDQTSRPLPGGLVLLRGIDRPAMRARRSNRRTRRARQTCRIRQMRPRTTSRSS